MDSYQAIYDAVRSKITGGNVSEAVRDVMRDTFDISHTIVMLRDDAQTVLWEQQRPFVLLKPRIFPDGNKWCALYGDNLQEGVAGFGDTPALAAADFDLQWNTSKCAIAQERNP